MEAKWSCWSFSYAHNLDVFFLFKKTNWQIKFNLLFLSYWKLNFFFLNVSVLLFNQNKKTTCFFLTGHHIQPLSAPYFLPFCSLRLSNPLRHIKHSAGDCAAVPPLPQFPPAFTSSPSLTNQPGVPRPAAERICSLSIQRWSHISQLEYSCL